MSPSEAERATLLVSCPDRRGIVAALAQVLYGHGANIFDSDQHTDPLAAQFFQRLHFDLTDLPTAARSNAPLPRWLNVSACVTSCATEHARSAWRCSFRATITACMTCCSATAAGSSAASCR